MKKMKKIFALLIAMVMVLGMSTSVFAATVEVKSVLDGETYNAYKILNYTANEDKTAVSYYLTKTEYDSGLGAALVAAGFAFTPSADGSQYVLNNADSVDLKGAAEKLATTENIATLALKSYEATGAGGSANFGTMDTGYYFVTTTAGSLCALHDEKDIATVVEKNTVPSVDKTQSKDGTTYGDTLLEENVGDTVYYKITVTDGTGTDADITLKDTLSEGLTYTAGSIKIAGTAVADDANTDNYSVSVSGQVITIVFKAAYVKTLDTAATVEITYEAKINEKAVVDSATGNENKVELDYSKQHSEDKTYVATYDATLKKADGEGENAKALAGAKFNLFKEETGGTALKFTKDTTGYYLDATNGAVEIDAGDGTGVNIRGLEPGTYWFEETEAPVGYNKLDKRVKVEVTAGATGAAEITVVNNAGSVLPSTGGIGTTIFYVIGAILVIGAGVVLVTRRRMNVQ